MFDYQVQQGDIEITVIFRPYTMSKFSKNKYKYISDFKSCTLRITPFFGKWSETEKDGKLVLFLQKNITEVSNQTI